MRRALQAHSRPQPGWVEAAAITAIVEGLAAVAQLDRVLGYEPRGRGFDSCQPHQKNKK